MEINNQIVLNIAKQRAHELEDELITYKIICSQQAEEIINYEKRIKELEEENKALKKQESK